MPVQHALYGFTVGTRLLAGRHIREALPYLIKPVNYWRTVEFAQTVAEADFRSGQRILDIGSPKLLALQLVESLGVELFATDIDGYFMEKMDRARRARNLSADRLRLEVQDGRQLTYADASFDRVYSVSVIEHIPDDGDSACIAEIVRVLKPGGRAVITVPFWSTSRTEYKNGDFYWASSSRDEEGKGTFYQRRYSEEDLRRRLVEPAKPATVRLKYVGERAVAPADREISDYLPAITGPIQPLLSRLLHVGPTEDWRTLAKPLCAILTIEKPT
ncbi:MAG: class I SAM-dependent methyltransferase [Gemmatimonadaceae bacterium]|nr:class I SAM-dependent methyltransferase [Gemmatimonadaceae bacterium]